MQITTRCLGSIFFAFWFVLPFGYAQNHVLSLDGKESYVTIQSTPQLQGGENVVKTIEAWFMPQEFPFPIVGKTLNAAIKDWALRLDGNGRIQFTSERDGNDYQADYPSALELNQWYHVAAVIDRPKRLLRLYLNGELVDEDPNMPNESAQTEREVEIGAYSYRSDFSKGYIDEVRIWNIALTAEQIRETMFTTLRGDEPGLVGYWQFEGEGDVVLDTTPYRHHGNTWASARRVAIELPKSISPFSLPRVSGIEGRLRRLNKEGKHVTLRVQLIRDGSVIAEQLSGREPPINGKYSFIDLEPGGYQVRCYTTDGYLYYRGGGIPTLDASQATLLHVEPGKTLKNIDFYFEKRGRWKNYGYMSKLGIVHVMAIHRDRNGFLWLGTYGEGVFRFDGKSFENFTTRDGLAHDDVRTIYEEDDGALWFGTRGGISRYDGTQFTRFADPDNRLGMSGVTCIYPAPDGTLWFGTYNRGVCRYDGKNFEFLTTEDGLTADVIHAIYRDADGVMWFATDAGVSRYDGEQFQKLKRKDGLPSNNIWDIYQDAEGVIWFATSRGISQYRPNEASSDDGRRFTNLMQKDGLAHNFVHSIFSAPDGTLWFGTSGGVSRYDGTGFVNFTRADGLVNNWVRPIYRDPDGVLWLGTKGGVSRYDDEKTVCTFQIHDGLSNNRVYSVHRDNDGAMWVGTRDGVSRYDGVDFTPFQPDSKLGRSSVRTVYRDSEDVLWVGTYGGGLFRDDGKTFKPFTTRNGLADNRVLEIHQATDGILWFGTANGLSRFDGQAFENYTTTDGLPHNWVKAIYPDTDGTLLIGTRRGVSAYDGKQFTDFPAPEKLARSYVTAIYRAPDASLWFSTGGDGIFRSHENEWKHFASRDGLPDDFISTIFRTADGVMWFGTYTSGVLLYDGVAWSSVSRDDGLPSNFVISIVEDDDGTLWFGTYRGLVRYQRTQTFLKVRIISVATEMTYQEISAIPKIRIGTRVTLEYDAVDFKTQPEHRQYQVTIRQSGNQAIKHSKITKSDNYDWTPDKPGAYTFEVQAIDRDLNYSEAVSLPLSVVVPWYLNGWITFPFVGGVFIVLISAIIFGWSYNIQRREALHLRGEMEEARKIQTSLLPQTQPMIPGFEIHGFSEPVSIGGDFYDYIPSENNEHLLIVVGDAIGHGLPAAMNAQSTYRLLKQIVTSQNLTKPDEILSQLNRILYNPTQGTLLSVSMYLAAMNLKRRKLRVSRAGDCRAYLIRGGRVSDLSEVKGNDLGASVTSRYAVKEYDLVPDDLIVVCSDGFIDALGADPQAPLDLLGGMDTASAVTAIESIQRSRVLSDGNWTDEKADDITVIGIKVREAQADRSPPDGADATHINLTIPAEFGYERTAIAAVARTAQSIGLAQERIEDLEIAVGEACINAFEHAYEGEVEGKVAVSIIISDVALTVRVQDFGRGGMTFDKTREKNPSSRGWGLHLIEKSVDGVEIESTEGVGTQVCMTVYLPNNETQGEIDA